MFFKNKTFYFLLAQCNSNIHWWKAPISTLQKSTSGETSWNHLRQKHDRINNLQESKIQTLHLLQWCIIKSCPPRKTKLDLSVRVIKSVRACMGCGLVGSFWGNFKNVFNHVPPKTTKFEVCTVVCPVYNHVRSSLAPLVCKQPKSCGTQG